MDKKLNIKFNKVLELSKDELMDNLTKLRSFMLNVRFAMAGGKMPKPHAIKAARRQIARILTALNVKGSNE